MFVVYSAGVEGAKGLINGICEITAIADLKTHIHVEDVLYGK